MTSRRILLATGAAGAGLATAGFGNTAIRWAAPPDDPRALAPEAQVDPLTGAVTPNPAQCMAHVACPGCGAGCGVRLRLDRATSAVLRVTGNPFHPLSADPPLPASASLRDAFAVLSRRHESGLAHRATVCPRAAAPPAGARLATPLKRVGARGAGGWKPIDLDRLVHEVVEGGDLFGEGPVEGLRRAGPVGLICGRENGRTRLPREVLQGFGNAGFAVQRAAAPIPDLRDTSFILMLGSATPAPPLARRIAAGSLAMVVADAMLGPAGTGTRWLPIRPGTEGALARGVLRHLRPDTAPAEDAAVICRVPEAEIAALARDFAAHGRGAACVAAAGTLGAEAVLAMTALNAAAGHAVPPPATWSPDGLRAAFLWDCDALPLPGVPLVVAVAAGLDGAARTADYVVPDTLPFESWGLQAGSAGVTTSWPAVPPPAAAVGMERLLLACARAQDLPGVRAGAPDDAATWYLRAIAGLAAGMPGITDDDLAQSGLDHLRPLLAGTLGEDGWRPAAGMLARGGRFDRPADTPPAPVLAAAPPAPADPFWPLLLAVRDPLLPDGPQPAVMLHAADATALGLHDGDPVLVETTAGTHAGRLTLRHGIARGVVAVTDRTLADAAPARLRRA